MFWTLVGLCAAGLLIGFIVHAVKKSKKEARRKKFYKQIWLENKQKEYAQKAGLTKFEAMDYDDYQKVIQAAVRLRESSAEMVNSVYQEKEKSWSIRGGIAEGLAGPAAGLATAYDTMQDNARIRAENAARREQAAKQNAYYQSFAEQTIKNSSHISMSELIAKYEAVMSWHPATLFNLINVDSASAIIDEETGAVTVSAKWSQKDKTICIDGAIRAKLYTSEGKCAGCAYLILPKYGTTGFEGSLSGICARPKASSRHSVKFEPFNLWELRTKSKYTSKATDGLTLDAHRKIVSEYEEKYQSELEAS